MNGWHTICPESRVVIQKYHLCDHIHLYGKVVVNPHGIRMTIAFDKAPFNPKAGVRFFMWQKGLRALSTEKFSSVFSLTAVGRAKGTDTMLRLD